MTLLVACYPENRRSLGPAATSAAEWQLKLNGRFEDVSATLISVRAWLQDRTGGHCGSSWEMALAECLNNIAEHAYADEVPGEIDLWLTVQSNQLSVIIRDYGSPMPNHTLPQVSAPDVTCALNELPEGGFGWFLIHELTTNLRYERLGSENWTGFEVSVNG